VATFIKRSRIVSFRVSEDEYLRLEEFSRTSGAHSVSDFVRATTHELVRHEEVIWMPRAEVRIMEERLKALRLEIEQLARSVQISITRQKAGRA
jgi:hypothetical protein